MKLLIVFSLAVIAVVWAGEPSSDYLPPGGGDAPAPPAAGPPSEYIPPAADEPAAPAPPAPAPPGPGPGGPGGEGPGTSVGGDGYRYRAIKRIKYRRRH